MIHSQVGELVRVAGFDTMRTAKGENGYVLYGPYFTLGPGSYEVDFHVLPEGKGKVPCCNVDVLASGKRVVVERLLMASDLIESKGAVTLAFQVETTDVYEFRAFATGRMGLSVRQERPVRLLSALPEEAARLIAASSAEAPHLFKAHYAFFEGLAKQGFSFAMQDAATILATYNGVSFTIENTEDFQLVGEIFLVNEYNIITARPAVAIDIGMNAGLTSLYFARMPHIRHVYSFEPFSVPFNRANKNFAFNPVLEAKITRQHVGLSDREETLSVQSNSTGTISVSVRGAGYGDSEQIAVRDASSMLRAVIEEAARAENDIILKVDCEGSEFAVFESLSRTGLLQQVTAVVCEWHKWWAADRTQFDIIDPLLASGFTVIDRTNPADPYAGLFYAIRTRP